MIERTYAEVRHLVKNGDAFFTCDPGPIGFGIRFWDKIHGGEGDVNHIGGITIALNRVFVTQATFSHGVHPILLSEFLRNRRKADVYWIQGGLTEEEQKKFAQNFASLWGLRYESLKGMIGTGLGNEKPTKNNRWFCSESYAFARRNMGTPRLEKKLGKTWPGHILKAFGGIERAVKITG
jgi:hypothetical protein